MRLTTQDHQGAIAEGTPPASGWQAAALQAATQCEAALWSASGAKARAWLDARGLTEATCRAWHLGYQGEDEEIGALYVRRGIVIPCFFEDAPWYVKVRRPVPPLAGPKYWQSRGSKLTLFGLDKLAGRPEIVICEGELDAMLLWQIAGDLVDVLAVAGAAQRPNAQTLLRLAEYRRWFIAFDRDDAGVKGTNWWGFAARTRPVRPLQGKDLTDFHLAGGDLRAWVEFLLAREGNPVEVNGTDQATAEVGEKIAAEPGALPLTPQEDPLVARALAKDATGSGAMQYPVLLLWPADAKVAVINGQWRRLAGGQIEAVYNNRDELAWCIETTMLLREELGGHATTR